MLEKEQHLLSEESFSEMQQQLQSIQTPDLLPQSEDRGRLYPSVFGYEALPETPYRAAASNSVTHDPMLHLAPQPQPRMLREVLHSLPHNKDNYSTEREMRQLHNDRYRALRELIPNPSKPDRASVTGDAIRYIKELQAQMEKNKNGREGKSKKGHKTKQQDNNNSGCSFFSKTWTLMWGSCSY